MALKKAVKPKTEDRFLELMSKCTDIDQKIFQLQQEKIEVQKEMLESIPSGRSTKEQKCLLECENGTLYLRPVNKDGELSGRHFSCTPVNKEYSEVLKRVRE